MLTLTSRQGSSPPHFSWAVQCRVAQICSGCVPATEPTGARGQSFTVTAVPNAPTITAVSPDTGVSTSDGVTNATTIVLSGKADSGTTVHIYEGGNLVGTATANGTWSATLASSLSEGSHTFTANATDSSGHTSAFGGAFTVTVDITPPTGSATLLSVGPDTGANTTDHITSATSLTFTGTADSNSIVQIYDGTATSAIATAYADGSGNWTAISVGKLADGSHSFTAKVADLAGNVGSASAALTMTVDSTAAVPVIASISTDTGSSSTDHITSDTTLLINGTAEANSTVSVFLGSSPLGTQAVDGSGHWTYDYTGTSLSDGSYTFTAKDTDFLGNVSSSSSAFTVTVDTKAPAPTITSVTPDTGSSTTDHITSATTLTLSGTTDASSKVTIFEGTTQIGTATSNNTGNWTLAGILETQGSHSFTASTTDAAGNTGVSAAFTVTVDTTGPGAPTIAGFTPDTGASSTDRLTSATTLTLFGTAEASSTVKIFDGTTTIATGTADASGHWSVTTNTLTTGSHTFTARDTDVAGNVGATASAAVTVTIDRTAPTVSSVVTSGSGITSGSGNLNAGKTVTLTVSLSEAVTVDTTGGTPVLLLNDNGKATYASGSGTKALVFTYKVASGENTSDLTVSGFNPNGGTIQDAAGNAANMSGAFTNPAGTLQIDTTPPSPLFTNIATTNSGLALSGTSEASSSIKVYNGTTLLGTTTASSSGSWSFSATTQQAPTNVVNNFTATATDKAGNVGSGFAEWGTTGNDTVASTAGNDTMWGRTGADTFTFGLNFGHDTIKDFTPSQGDVIQFNQALFTNFAAMMQNNTKQVGTNTVITDTAGDTLTLTNVTPSTLQSKNFTFV